MVDKMEKIIMENNKKTLKLVFAVFIFSLIFILLSGKVLAIGITPGRATFDFEPGKEGSVDFKIINNEHKDMKVLFYVEGELNDSITLYQKIIVMGAGENEKSFKYSFKMPQFLEEPGIHEARIIAMEIPKDAIEQGTYVGSAVAVAMQFYVRVPYPKKYIEARCDVLEGDVGDNIRFVVSASNLGEQRIVNAHAVIDILSKTGDKIATVKTNTHGIESMKRTELIAEWKAEAEPGSYLARISIIYDEKITEIEKTFQIGTLRIDLNDVVVEDFRLGGIAKFILLIENKWGGALKDVYARVLIFDDADKNIADSKSASTDLGPLAKTTLFAYLDTAGIDRGIYDGKIVLNYANKTIEKEITVNVQDDSLTVNILGVTGKAVGGGTGMSTNMNFLLIILVVILILINLLWFLYFRKKKKK